MRASTTQEILTRLAVLQAWAIRLVHEELRSWTQVCLLMKALQLFKENKPFRIIAGPNPRTAWYTEDQLKRNLGGFGYWQGPGRQKSLDPEIVKTLAKIGVETLEQLLELEPADLQQIRALGSKGVEGIVEFLYWQLPQRALGGGYTGIGGPDRWYAVEAQPIEACFDALRGGSTGHSGLIRVQICGGEDLDSLPERLGEKREPYRGTVVMYVQEIKWSAGWLVSGQLESIDNRGYNNVEAHLWYARDVPVRLRLEYIPPKD